MTIPTPALARALQHTRPPVWPLRFRVSALEPARGNTPGFYRAHAQAPSNAGAYTIEAVGARVVLSFVSRRGDASTTQHASIDEAETAAMQSALKQLGKYRPRLRWQPTKGEDFSAQAEVDLPIWGRGVLRIPGRFGGQWNGIEPWGQEYRSSMPTSREGVQRFVDNWLAMTTKGVRYYRVFPYLIGKDDAYPAGAVRQLREAEIVEAAVKLRARKHAQTDRDLALVTVDVSPVFNWDLKGVGTQWKPVPSDEHPSKRHAEHHGFFGIGQIVGAYEIVEYTTGPRAAVRSLGHWKAPTLDVWRETHAEPTKIEPQRGAQHKSYGQLELLAEIAGLALEAAL